MTSVFIESLDTTSNDGRSYIRGNAEFNLSQVTLLDVETRQFLHTRGLEHRRIAVKTRCVRHYFTR